MQKELTINHLHFADEVYNFVFPKINSDYFP